MTIWEISIVDLLQKICSEVISNDVRFVAKSVVFSYGIGIGLIFLVWFLINLGSWISTLVLPLFSALSLQIYRLIARIPLYYVFRRILIPILWFLSSLIPRRVIFHVILLLYTPIWFFLFEFEFLPIPKNTKDLYISREKKKAITKSSSSSSVIVLFPNLDMYLTPMWFISNFFYNCSVITMALRHYNSKVKTLQLSISIDDNISLHSASSPKFDRVYKFNETVKPRSQSSAVMEQSIPVINNFGLSLHLPSTSESPQRVPFKECNHDDSITFPPLASTLLPVMKREPSLRMMPFLKKQSSFKEASFRLVKPLMENYFDAGKDKIETITQSASALEMERLEDKQLENVSDDELESKGSYPTTPSILESTFIPGLALSDISSEPDSPEMREKSVSLDDRIRLFGGRTPMKARTTKSRSPHLGKEAREEAYETRYTSTSIESLLLSPVPLDDNISATEHPGPLNARAFWKSKNLLKKSHSPVLNRRTSINFPIGGGMLNGLLSPLQALALSTQTATTSRATTTSTADSSILSSLDEPLRMHRSSTFSGFSGNEYPIGHDPEEGYPLFTYKELVRRNYCKDFSEVDSKQLEKYLTDEEFYTLFTMNRNQFDELPAWRRVAIKKALTLF